VLKTHVNVSDGLLGLGVFGSTYNPAMVEADLNDLERYYRSFGFHDVHVSRDLQWTPDGRDLILTFHIQEGQRYRVKDVPTVDGVRFMPHEALEAISKVKAGDYYNENVIDGDLKRIKDYIGYMGREVRTQSVPIYSRDVPGLVQVQYEVEERPPARVG